ncbi:MAG: S8 family serine peptidase [Crocinitomicaceae bacterium]
MKYLTLLFVLIVSNQLLSQKSPFTFQQFIEQKVKPISMPFALKNSAKNKNYLEVLGIRLKHETQNYLFCHGDADLFYTAQLSGKLEEVYFHISRPKLMSDSALTHHKGNLVHAGLGGLDTSYTGKGVVIGIVDQGIDYNHPDFQNPDGSTRVLRYWDHTVNDNNHPNYYELYEKGILWDSAAINNGSCTSLEVSSAHGSTVSGMAASNGLANGTNKGFAPEADLIVVESDFSQDVYNWKLSIADACDYIFKVADSLNKPAVINLSLGDYYGMHDATDPAAELINSLLDEKEGRIVVSAAGNSGDYGPYHVGTDVTSDTSFVWSIPNPSQTIVNNVNDVVIFDFVVDTSEASFSFAISSCNPNNQYERTGSTAFLPFSSGFTTGIPEFENIENENGDLIAVAFVYRETFGSNIIGQIAVSGPGFTPIDSSEYLFGFETFGSGHYDLWGGTFSGRSNFVIEVPDSASVPEIIHYISPDTLQTIVDSWNCSEKVISVGNLRNRMGHIDLNGNTYNASPGIAVGELYSASSIGPSRTGVQKPDITASGDISLGSGPFSWLNNPANASLIDQGGFHIRNGGTSMASPVVAGIAALYLQKCPGASYQDFKNDLTANTDIDAFTGSVPNYAYGYGKANALLTLLAKHEPVFIDGPDGICPGALATFGYSSDLIPVAISWSNGATSASITTATPGDYQVTLADAMGCASRSAVQPLLSFTNPSVNAGSDHLICPNSQLTLTATGTATMFQWNNGVIQSEPFIPPAGTYIVVGFNEDGCSATDTTNIELLSTIQVEYIENISEIGVNQTAFNVTTGEPIGGVYSGPGIIGTSFHPGLAGIGTHEIVYAVTDGNGCVSTDTSVIEVYEDAGLLDLSSVAINIAPNPFTDEIQVLLSEPTELSIYDLKGKLVYQRNMAYSQHIQLHQLAPGLYQLLAKQISSNKISSVKLIKQR